MGSKMNIKSFHKKNQKHKKYMIRLSLVLLIAIGVIYQQLGIYYSASSLGRVGKLVDVDGVNMHLYEAGNSDIPLVFTSTIGSSVPYVDTYPLHSKLSANHQTIVYDKPGYGWSELTSASRDIDTICKEIHTLLHSNENPDDEDTFLKPFVYVAYGMGSLEAIRYAQLYPEDVAGIVLIEGASPQFCADFNNIMIIESFFTNGLRNLGLLRLFSGTNTAQNALSMHKEYSSELQHLNKGIGLEKTWNRNMISEKLNIQDSAETILSSHDLGDIPLRIITSKANIYSNWNKTQRDMLSLSTNAEQIWIEQSTTFIEESDVPTITKTIEELVTSIIEERENY